ncbi:MAG: glycosyltransferase family 4 protein [Myxococcota bacterium]
MRILLVDREDANARPGGDSVVVAETAAFLRAAGHRVEIGPRVSSAASFDAVHLFNLTRPEGALAAARAARAARTPYFLTPIYWDLIDGVPWQAYEFPRSLRIRWTPSSLRRRGRRPPFPDERALQAEILTFAQSVFPASEAERRHLLDRFGSVLRSDRVVVSPHGVERPATTQPPGMATTQPPGMDGGALVCAGAIGPRKNQLGLVRALTETPSVDLRIVGDVARGAERYARAVERTAGPNVRFESAVPRDRIGDQLANAAAVVQPSFVETPGLAAMEARTLGRPIVVSAFPPVRETFGDDPLVFYCDPLVPDSIRSACRAALDAAPDDGRAFAADRTWGILLAPLATAYAELANATAPPSPARP